jgi:peptide deformylase
MSQILSENHPLLHQKSLAVPIPLLEADQRLMNELRDFISFTPMGNRNCCGIAAPQLGIPKRIIAINLQDESGHWHCFALANPEIIYRSPRLSHYPGGEGCLSVESRHHGLVFRPETVTIRGYTSNGRLVQGQFSGKMAMVLQHEIDHLDGILFTQRMSHRD